MPEPSSQPRMQGRWALANADQSGQIVRVECYHCSITRHYYPADLQALLGNVQPGGIRMRCEKCRKTDWIQASFVRLSAAERQAIRMRKLVEVRMVRKVIWQDE